jgi:hypothetical protein
VALRALLEDFQDLQRGTVALRPVLLSSSMLAWPWFDWG